MADKGNGKFTEPDGKLGGGSGEGVSDATFTVGYRKPPRFTRVRSVQSGNPSGRLRKPRSLAHELLEVLQEPVTLGAGEARETPLG